ncbi:unnamed protein product [marine sediment metagenome]|uniref:Uncharacterized protein n=1 Tax=marine sediment metagenome TaxID=412755 RepID=X1HIP9_9ZZZZ
MDSFLEVVFNIPVHKLFTYAPPDRYQQVEHYTRSNDRLTDF